MISSIHVSNIPLCWVLEKSTPTTQGWAHPPPFFLKRGTGVQQMQASACWINHHSRCWDMCPQMPPSPCIDIHGPDAPILLMFLNIIYKCGPPDEQSSCLMHEYRRGFWRTVSPFLKVKQSWTETWVTTGAPQVANKHSLLLLTSYLAIILALLFANVIFFPEPSGWKRSLHTEPSCQLTDHERTFQICQYAIDPNTLQLGRDAK